MMHFYEYKEKYNNNNMIIMNVKQINQREGEREKERDREGEMTYILELKYILTGNMCLM